VKARDRHRRHFDLAGKLGGRANHLAESLAGKLRQVQRRVRRIGGIKLRPGRRQQPPLVPANERTGRFIGAQRDEQAGRVSRHGSSPASVRSETPGMVMPQGPIDLEQLGQQK
jgi:hypothetical protein